MRLGLSVKAGAKKSETSQDAGELGEAGGGRGVGRDGVDGGGGSTTVSLELGRQEKGKRERPGRGMGELRIGFVPLLDAAPLLMAKELGYFESEGLSVVLERQLGWGNIRDKLASGWLDAAHALLGIPVASCAGLRGMPGKDQFVAVLSLGTGGDAITIDRRIVEAAELASSQGKVDGWQIGQELKAMARRGKGRPVLGHVFGLSVHHYLLRIWLERAGLNPDEDVELCVLPPPQVATQLGKGHLSGFCAGEPWNTVAQHAGMGRVVAYTTELVAGHPDKVLAVGRNWLGRNGETAVRLCRAVLRAGAWLNSPVNRGEAVRVLCERGYLDVSPAVLERCMSGIGMSVRGTALSGASVRADGSGALGGAVPRSLSASAMYPSRRFVAWLVGEMKRWKHLPAGEETDRLVRSVVEPAAFERAAAELNVQLSDRIKTEIASQAASGADGAREKLEGQGVR